MGDFIKAASLTAFLSLATLNLSAIGLDETNFENSSFQQTTEANIFLGKKNKKKPINKNDTVRSLQIPAQGFVVSNDTGSALIEQNVSKGEELAIFYVLEFPYSSEAPTASTAFSMPKGFDKKLNSFIKFPFLTVSNIESISGNVVFSVVASVLRNNTSVDIQLGEFTTEDVETASPAYPGSPPANQYLVKVDTTGKFVNGDFVTLIITRVNVDVEGNFESSVYVPGAQFTYNIRN